MDRVLEKAVDQLKGQIENRAAAAGAPTDRRDANSVVRAGSVQRRMQSIPSLTLPARTSEHPTPMTAELAVLFEDNHCLAVAKPAPLLTQGVRRAFPAWRRWSKPILKNAITSPATSTSAFRIGSTGRCRAWWCSRATARPRRGWPSSLPQRQVRKVYWAVVEPNAEGDLPPEEGVWEDWLLKIRDEARTERVSAETPGARSRRCCAFGGCRRRQTGRCWRSSRKRGGCTRFASRRRRAAGRCAATSSMGRGCRSVRRRSCRATASSPCTPAV